MNYIYSAHLAGRLCKEDCRIDYDNVRVSLYRSREKHCPNDPNVAKTFAELSQVDISAKQPDLLVSGSTDGDGNVTLVIDTDKVSYRGECIEVVVTLDHIPKMGKALDPSEYLLIARYRPEWEESDNEKKHFSRLHVPPNLWCAYLKKHDVWVICGRVTTCSQPQMPIGKVTVKAYDTDWLQHDFLGQATTDAAGWFFIFYDSSKFKRTPLSPFLNFEWVGGPDVYFQIEGLDSEGNPVLLLDEPPSRGRKPDREDITNCFCVDLCVELGSPLPWQTPMWTHIGNYQIPDTSSLHDFTADGYTKSGNLAFFSTMDFVGQTGTPTTTRKLRYRFLYAEGDPPPVPTNPVTKDMIAETKVGVIITSFSPLTLEPVYVNKPGALHNHEPDPNGWIEVEDNPLFTPASNKLIRLRSNHLAPFETYSNPAPNPSAGNPATIDVPREIHTFSLRYELQENVSGGGWVTIHDQNMDKLVINNARTLLHLELDEFIIGSTMCHPISSTVTVRYTADHPHLDWYEVEIERQGTNMAWPVPRVNHGGSLTFRGGNATGAPPTATNPVDVTGWTPCSYVVLLRAHRRLTTGYSGPSNEFVYRTFCKS